MSPARGLGVGVVFDGALAHTVARWGAGSFLLRWRTRPVSERWLLQEVYDFLNFHGRPKRTGKPWTRGRGDRARTYFQGWNCVRPTRRA